MDTNQNKDCDYYIKELENEKKEKFYVFFVNKDIPLTDEILQEMAKYEIVEFCNLFDQPIDDLPSGVKSLTISKKYRKTLDNLPVSVEIIRY